MKPVTIINRLAIKPGKMDDFIAAQRNFAAELRKTSDALVGGRMYRSVDGTSAVLVSTFASMQAQEEVRELDAFKAHLSHLKTMVESSSPVLYEEAYTTGEFR
jgi:heme-degrading monooxygenase HmoA